VTKTEFSFTATDEMSPSSHVIVYYITSDGEIISDKLKIELESDLKNQIDIQLSENQVKPSADLNITINTKEDSYVGLLGVDQSVLVMRKGNDIAKSKVMEELKEYNKGIESYNSKSYKDFKDSGLIILTNTKSEFIPLYRQTARLRTRNRISYNSYSVNRELTMIPKSANMPQYPLTTYDIRVASDEYDENEDEVISTTVRSRKVSKKVHEKKTIEIRQEFPETWLFDSFNLNSK